MRRLLPLVLLLAVAASVPASADAYKATLTVQGGLTAKRAYDTLQQCSPGQGWVLSAGVEMRLKARVEVSGSTAFVTAYTAKQVKGSEHTKQITGYSETNFCAPFDPIEQIKPKCQGFAVPGTATGLTTRGARKLYLALNAGARTPQEQGGECGTPTMKPTDSNAVLSALQWGGAGLVLPLDLRTRSALTLGHGKKLIRRLRVVGPCDTARITHGKAEVTPLNPLEDGDCIVDGAINVELKRL
jgi:hypothetical protein